MHSNSKIIDWILISIFLGSLGIIILATIFSWDFHDVQDYRGLAENPDITSVRLHNFPAQFESYLNDHFGFRNTFVLRYIKLIEGSLGQKSRKVIIGENSY